MSTNRFQLWYAAQPRALRMLLTINVIVYVIWNLFLIHFGATRSFVLEHVALNPSWPGILFQPWQLLTYSFLHLSPGLGGLLHIGFNMLWMLWIGRDYESLYGPGRILGVYILGAMGGALLTVALHAAFPGVGPFGGIVHGASGAVLALMTMVAIHQPEQRIGLMFIGVVKLIHVVIGFIALDILFLSAGGTSVSAHLGGVATGYLLGRLARDGMNPTPWADWFFAGRGSDPGSGSVLQSMEEWLSSRKKGGGERASDGGARIYHMERGGSAADSSIDSGSEIDRILDKISESGYDSLTDKEKRMLIDSSGEG